MTSKFFRQCKKIFSRDSCGTIWVFVKHYFVQIYHRVDEHHVFLSGGGIAFSLFASTIPLSLIIFAILGGFIEPTRIEDQVTNLIYTIIPYPEYAESVINIILSRIPEVLQYQTTAAYIGIIGLFFVASGLFSSMRTVLNNIFGVTEDKHAIIAKLRDFMMVLLLIIFILLLAFIFPAIRILINASDRIPFFEYFRVSAIISFLFSLVSAAVIFVLFFIFYYVIPYEKLGKKVAAVAAFWTTVLWEVARQIFGYYISHIPSINRIYGAYAFVVVVALWIYYSSILFILGAEIGQLYRERLLIKKMEEEDEKAQ